MKEQDLIEADYTEYSPNNILRSEDRAYQKWFYSLAGSKSYSIHISVYDRPDMTEGFHGHAQFRRTDGIIFNVEFLIHDETIDTIEAFYKDVFDKMDCTHYNNY